MFLAIAGSYMAALILVSLLSPAKVVSVGDSYCWDLWCVGVQQVNKSQQGQNILYTADVALSRRPQILRGYRRVKGSSSFMLWMTMAGALKFAKRPSATRVTS